MNEQAVGLDSMPDILTAENLGALFHMSRAGVYNLLNSSDFPTLHVGCRKFVTKDNLIAWMERNTNHGAS